MPAQNEHLLAGVQVPLPDLAMRLELAEGVLLRLAAAGEQPFAVCRQCQAIDRGAQGERLLARLQLCRKRQIDFCRSRQA